MMGRDALSRWMRKEGASVCVLFLMSLRCWVRSRVLIRNVVYKRQD